MIKIVVCAAVAATVSMAWTVMAFAQVAVTVDCTRIPTALATTNFVQNTVYNIKSTCNGDFYIYAAGVTLQPLAPAKSVTVTGPIAAFAPGVTLNDIDIKGPGNGTSGIVAGLWTNGGVSNITFNGGTITGAIGYGVLAANGASIYLINAKITGNIGYGVAATINGQIYMGQLNSSGTPIDTDTVSGNASAGLLAAENGSIFSNGTTLSDDQSEEILATDNGFIRFLGGKITATASPPTTAVEAADGGGVELVPATASGAGPTITASSYGVLATVSGHAAMRAVSVTVTGTAAAIQASIGSTLNLRGGNKIKTTNAAGLAAVVSESSVLQAYDGSSAGYPAETNTVAGPTIGTPFEILDTSSALLFDMTVTGEVEVRATSELKLEATGGDTVTLNNGVLFSMASGGRSTGAAANTSIKNGVTCGDSTSHFNAANVTISGANNCASFQ